MRVAAIDCGTNSIRLLVADVDATAGSLIDIDREMRIVRLGYGVDRTGRLDPAALDRTFNALRDYAATIERRGAQCVRMVATSATRDAENRLEFVTGVHDILGVDPEVVSGDEEAGLSFAGATRGLSTIAPPYLVVDIGGGSTEFVLGTGAVDGARSVDIGCVRLTERHLRDDPPTFEQIAAASLDIDAALDEVERAVSIDAGASLVGLAGSVTTVAAIALGLESYQPERIHHSRIAYVDVKAVARQLLDMRHDERASLGVMHPGRVDVIGAGALILATVMDRFGYPEVVVSEHDILDGIAWSCLSD